MLNDHSFPVIINTDIHANSAIGVAGSGGGLYFRTMNSGLVLDQVSISGNVASLDGGGVMLSMANVAAIVQSSTIDGNVAETGSGGGFSLTTGQ